MSLLLKFRLRHDQLKISFKIIIKQLSSAQQDIRKHSFHVSVLCFMLLSYLVELSHVSNGAPHYGEK